MAEKAATTFFPSSHLHVERHQLFFQVFLIAHKDVPDNVSFRLWKNLYQSPAVEDADSPILGYPVTEVVAFHLPSKLR